jgi:hypothetical protein
LPLNARADEVALQLGEHDGHVRDRVAHLRTGVHPISVTIIHQPCSSDMRSSRAKSSVQRLARSTLKNCRVLVQCDPYIRKC